MFKYIKSLISLLAVITAMPGIYAFENGQTVRLAIGGKSLMTENSSLDESKNALLWTETGTNSQRWILEDTGKGTFYLYNAYSGLYLGGISSSSAGSPVGQVRKTVAATRGIWELVPVEGETGKYHIYLGTARRYALASEATVTEGSKVTIALAASVAEERIMWSVETVEPQPNALTEEMRDDMMDKWKAKYYKKASTGYVIGNGGWWGDAEMFEVVLDAYETTGNTEYSTMFDNLYTNFISRKGSTWYQQGVAGYNEYNDDIAWMCIACVRGYLMTGQTKFLTTARNNFNGMFKRADCYGTDLLQWKHSSTGQGTTACINGPASVCACYLAIATADTTYYQKARKTYEANRKYLYEYKNGVFTGKIYDSYDQNNGSYNSWSSTYNQGTCLGAAIMLYQHYGDEKYKNDADAIAKWTKANLANSKELIHVCQTVSGDLCGFKGILMRYVRQYAAVMGHPEYYDWLAKNAYHAWNNRNSSGITSSAWLYKAEEDFKHLEGESLKSFGCEGCFTAVSAAFNTHLGAVDYRNAYDTLQAEDFNYIRNVRILREGTDEDGTGMTGPMKNNNYIGYRNVDFGSLAASHILARTFFYRTNAKLNVYMDAPNEKNGTLLCTIDGADVDELNTWTNCKVQLDRPVNGKHDIYVVASGLAGVNLASLNWFSFATENHLYGDVTGNGGTLSTSLTDISPLALTALTDNDVCTGFTAANDGQIAYVQYASTAPVLPMGYALYSGLEASHPQSWRLLGSTDGSKWDLLHEVSETDIVALGQKFAYDLKTENRYSFFRLEFVLPEGQNNLSLAEWQIFGHGISKDDITSDQGTITEGSESLIDHVGETMLQLPATSVYKSNGNYLLRSYSLTGIGEGIPASWAIEGSANGTSWTTIDTQSDYIAPYDNCTSSFEVNPAKPYIYYRLKSLSEGSSATQWQMYGDIDYGTFYPELSTFCILTASDGSPSASLYDDDGQTSAVISSEDACWTYTSSIPFKVLGYSALCSDVPDFDPETIIVIGIDTTGTAVQLSSRDVTFAARGLRAQYTLSSSKMFKSIEFHLTNTKSSTVSLAELEVYGCALAETGSECLQEASAIEASEEALATTEVVTKLTDGSRLTRFRSDFPKPVSITYTYDNPVKIDAYTLTASKDNASCDPSSWILEGSNDGEQWQEIDSRQGQVFSHRYATQFYALDDEAEYSRYRLTVSSLCGGSQLQLAELQLLSMQSLSTSIAAVPLGGNAPAISFDGAVVNISTPTQAIVQVYDIQGKMLEELRVPSGSHSIPFTFADGMYVISCKTGESAGSIKVVK